MNINNNFGRLLTLLLLGMTAGFGMYYLPDNLGSIKLKQVDLLSDLRVKPNNKVLDSLRLQLQEPDSSFLDSIPIELAPVNQLDSIRQIKRDSLYRAMNDGAGSDSLGLRIEDYSNGHIGLKHFFATLNKRNSIDRPVRIAFLGDSFIEGDIMVGDFRSLMQQKFGGRGVGFVPIASMASMFRPTVEVKEQGWKTESLLTETSETFFISGLQFKAESDPVSVSVKMTERYPELASCSVLSFIYSKNKHTSLQLVINGDTSIKQLKPTATLEEYKQTGSFKSAGFTLSNTSDFQALGIAMEDDKGISIDNFSLRGNSGMPLARLDKEKCKEWNEIRPYDLIVLQYGLNVVSDSMMQYGWYTKRMEEVIHHIRVCFPESDLLLLSVSDRANQADGTFSTMPEVLAMVHAQRRLARRTGIAFWNMFGAMGGENSMVRYVENNWASKDYTHLSFRGGKEIATLLLNALMLEKEFYDEADKLDH